MSIFVSIASYCDPVLDFTIESALANARRPDDLHFGVVDQAEATLEPQRQMSYLRIDPGYARGPCWARAIAMGFYRGEDWFLQLDSHMDFDPGWDERLVAQAQALAPGRKGVVLTTYPNAFVFDDGKPVHKPVTDKVLALTVVKGSHFAEDRLTLAFEGHQVEVDQPLQGFHVGAGCLFAHGRFAVDFPYDPSLYFHGEEQSLALRLYTHGWDIFHPPGMPIYHLYNDANAGAPQRPMHWDAGQEAKRKVRYAELEARSRRRLVDLVSGAPLGVYGLGGSRTVAEFAGFSGIDYKRRKVRPHAHLPCMRFSASLSQPYRMWEAIREAEELGETEQR